MTPYRLPVLPTKWTLICPVAIIRTRGRETEQIPKSNQKDLSTGICTYIANPNPNRPDG
jgi:hypothetical protein